LFSAASLPKSAFVDVDIRCGATGQIAFDAAGFQFLAKPCDSRFIQPALSTNDRPKSVAITGLPSRIGRFSSRTCPSRRQRNRTGID
jgi:hypothetical protein